MRIVILLEGKVRKGDITYICDLSNCGLPNDFWALQWEEFKPNEGHIEFISPLTENQQITELPQWAINCLDKWQEKDNEQKALELAILNNQKDVTNESTIN